MSEYYSVSAYRGLEAGTLADAITAYVHKHEVKTEAVTPFDAVDEHKDIDIFNSGGWVVARGPAFFNGFDLPMVRALAASNDWVASLVRVDDGNYWEHFAFDGSRVLHEFSSRPHYWAQEAPDIEALMVAYHSSPEKLCEKLGVDEGLISPYLVDVDALSEDGQRKAHQTDEFPLIDYWVYVDFWKRLGITYPDARQPDARVRLSRFYAKRLPRDM